MKGILRGALSECQQLTSDKKLPVVGILKVRREELRRALIVQRNKKELARLQGRAEEIDAVITALEMN